MDFNRHNVGCVLESKRTTDRTKRSERTTERYHSQQIGMTRQHDSYVTSCVHAMRAMGMIWRYEQLENADGTDMNSEYKPSNEDVIIIYLMQLLGLSHRR